MEATKAEIFHSYNLCVAHTNKVLDPTLPTMQPKNPSLIRPTPPHTNSAPEFVETIHVCQKLGLNTTNVSKEAYERNNIYYHGLTKRQSMWMAGTRDSLTGCNQATNAL